MEILAAYHWFPNVLSIATKEKDERAIIQIVAVRADWNDANDSQRQIYERRWVENDKRWVETWFDRSYKPEQKI